MDNLNSLMAVLELTGGARIVLRSDERPHVIVGDTRHELGSAQVPTTSSLEALADRDLVPGGKACTGGTAGSCRIADRT